MLNDYVAYMNETSLQEQVLSLRNRSNLIGWYTGDEPDGPDIADNETMLAYNTIYQYDGYHPVSVTLNCENYKFIQYGINGADQIRVDPYPVNVNGAFSRKYGTVSNVYFGVNGCDNCEGSIYDTINRVDSTIDRIRLSGLYRLKQAWSVSQAFDDYGDTFWSAPPTGNDVAVQMVVSLNHGSSGLTPFDAPGSPLEAFTVSRQISVTPRCDQRVNDQLTSVCYSRTHRLSRIWSPVTTHSSQITPIPVQR